MGLVQRLVAPLGACAVLTKWTEWTFVVAVHCYDDSTVNIVAAITVTVIISVCVFVHLSVCPSACLCVCVCVCVLVGSTWPTMMPSIAPMSPVKMVYLASVTIVPRCVFLWLCGMAKMASWRRDFLALMDQKWACLIVSKWLIMEYMTQ